jgi:uncharacterized lipoprotein YehR (DUF1307 family)
MRPIIIIFALALIVMLSGCDEAAKQAQNTPFNQNSAENPKFICKMKDGRTLFCMEVQNGWAVHYVYFFDTNSSTVSINYREGKQSKTIVLDGQTYQLIPLEKK